MVLQLKLLGSLNIETDGVPSDLLKSPKGCALITYLIVTGQTCRREFLADLLWDAPSTSQALHNLRALLNRIRDLVPELHITRTRLTFQPLPETSVDFLRLQSALDLDPAQIDNSPLDAALQLYCGDLLANFYLEGAPRFDEWLALEREHLRQRVLGVYSRLCQNYLQAEQWSNGLALVGHWLSLDPLNEEAVRACMQILAARGEPGEGLQQYESFCEQLWKRFELDPEPATVSLAARLKELLEEQEQGLTWEHISTPAFPEPGELPDPGPLSPNSILPYRRNPDFTGREADLLAVAENLFSQEETSASATVAITGMGGLGKTQTAVEFAYRYGRYFPGGVYWMHFADPDEAPAEIAATGGERGLGLYREAENLSLTDQVGRVQRAWQEPVPRLLIFDNCELEALLEQWRPVTGGCRILLTSRRAEWSRGLNLTCLPLNVLRRSESTRLLQSLAPDLGQNHADEIAAEVGDLPLALHLAGSFLARYRQVSPAVYLDQLRDKSLFEHPSLQGRGLSLSPTGHELNVVRTYTLSWEQLNPADQVDSAARQLLACAACLAPAEPIPAVWLKKLVRTDGDDLMTTILAEDGLSRLVSLGLLKKEGQAVVLHPLLASFTQEASGEKETDRALIAVGDLMAQTLSEHRQATGSLSVLPIPVAHVRIVCEEISRHRLPITASLLTQWGYYLNEIGNSGEAEKILTQACDLASKCGDKVTHAQALTALGNTQEALGHDDESFESLSQAVKLFKQAPHSKPDGLVEALYYLGWMYYRLGQANNALEVAREAHELVRSVSLPLAQGSVLNLIGVVEYYMLGEYESAQGHLEEALNVYQEANNQYGKCFILNNMGENARLQGNHELAIRYYEQALVIARRLEAHDKADVYLSNLCGSLIHTGQIETSIKDLEDLVSGKQHDWYGLSEAYRFLAEAYLIKGSLSQSLIMAQQALASASKSNSFDIGRAWRVLALIAAQLGEPIQADIENKQTYDVEACFRCCLDFFKEREFRRDRAITLWHWARVELEQGNKKQGQEMWQEAHDIFTRLNLPLMIAHMETETDGQ